MVAKNGQRDREHAVVIGASMGGLVAAAALAAHYERVTVIERDALPATASHRRGVPQSKHAHGLQPGGLRALDSLLPGLTDELVSKGAPIGDVSGDASWTVGGNRFVRGQAGVLGVGVTRPFLEHHVRSRVAALPNVTIRDGVEALRPIADARRHVIGIEIAAPDGTHAERVMADLVVDASGKVSKLPQWLASLGYATPAEESVHCRMEYLTRRWRLADGRHAGDIISVVTPAERPQFGVIIAQEDGSHIVTLGGLLESGPERSDDAYLSFARALPNPVIADALVGATPITDLQPSHFPASRRRRYDKLRDFPRGLLALGDSIASFNPMYGQGMTVAALQAVALRDALGRGRLDARTYFRTAHRIEDVAWKIATGGDLRYEAVNGRRTPDLKLMNRYLDRLTAAAQTDPVLARQFLLVAGFIEPPQSFFKPSIVRRVFAKRPVSVTTDVSVEPASERSEGVPSLGDLGLGTLGG